MAREGLAADKKVVSMTRARTATLAALRGRFWPRAVSVTAQATLSGAAQDTRREDEAGGRSSTTTRRTSRAGMPRAGVPCSRRAAQSAIDSAASGRTSAPI